MYNDKGIPKMGEKDYYKYLGIRINADLNWKEQKDYINKKALNILKIFNFLPVNSFWRSIMIQSMVFSQFRYSALFMNFQKKELKKLESELTKSYNKYYKMTGGNIGARYTHYKKGGSFDFDLTKEIQIQSICDIIRIINNEIKQEETRNSDKKGAVQSPLLHKFQNN